MFAQKFSYVIRMTSIFYMRWKIQNRFLGISIREIASVYTLCPTCGHTHALFDMVGETGGGLGMGSWTHHVLEHSLGQLQKIDFAVAPGLKSRFDRKSLLRPMQKNLAIGCAEKLESSGANSRLEIPRDRPYLGGFPNVNCIPRDHLEDP